MKRKSVMRMVTALMIFGLALSGGQTTALAASGRAAAVQSAAAKTKASSGKTAGKKASKSSKSKKASKSSKSAKKVTYVSAYQKVLNDYISGKNWFDFGGLATSMTEPDNAPQNPEFALFDFNADGTPELLVGDNWNYGVSGWMMYSFHGTTAKAMGLITGYNASTGGYICAEDGGWTFYNYDGTQLAQAGAIWDEEDGSGTLTYYPAGGEGTPVTQEAANAIAAQYQNIPDLLPLTPLNQVAVNALK